VILQNHTDSEIILIEDNPFDAELILRALQTKDLAGKVKVFANGVEALEFLFGNGDLSLTDAAASSRLPKVIFLDLKLPQMNGLEILSQIKNNPRTRLIPVVMLTSSEEESDIQESYRLSVNSYMVKPVDYEEFLQAVEDLGIYWLCRNRVTV
jgi:two-component system response regulator